MRLLLDHCVPRKSAASLAEHEVYTAAQQGWTVLRNGDLLSAAAAAGFDALLTVDQNLRYQQNQMTLPLSVVVLIAASNQLAQLQRLVPPLRRALISLPDRSYIEVVPD